MLADDDGDFRDTVAAFLGALDWIDVVGTAPDGAAAVRLFSERAPDVVVMDLLMPGKDGVEATAEIVAADPTVRVLILTASDDHRLLALGMRAGARACLRKEPLVQRMLPLMLALMRGQMLAGGSREEAAKGSVHDARSRSPESHESSIVRLRHVRRRRACRGGLERWLDVARTRLAGSDLVPASSALR